MPNLLKYLPREILTDKDTQFIYNILNPLLLEKFKLFDNDQKIEKKVHEIFYSPDDVILQDFRLPHNYDNRSTTFYLEYGTERKNIDIIETEEEAKELSNLRDYFMFYFNINEYSYLIQLVEKYLFIRREYLKYKELKENAFKEYSLAVEIEKKKILKSAYEKYNDLYETYHQLYIEFNVILDVLSDAESYSINQNVDRMANGLANSLNLRTFDNDIIFRKSELISFLEDHIDYPNKVTKNIFNGTTVISNTSIEVKHIIELISVFSNELFSIIEKYNEYLNLIDNDGIKIYMERTQSKLLKNQVLNTITMSLDNNNLTYFIDELNNQLDIYIYFDKQYRIKENTLKLVINGELIKKTLVSINGYQHRGFDIYSYMDDEFIYYKVSVINYVEYDLDDMPTNNIIDDLSIEADLVANNIDDVEDGTIIETTDFIDNFKIYKFNEVTKFYEELKVGYNVTISVVESGELYKRVYEIKGINSYFQELLSESTAKYRITYLSYNYYYKPILHLDFFKYMDAVVQIKYNAIMEYVLLEDFSESEITIPYYEELNYLNYSSNILKNVKLSDQKTYKELFYDAGDLRILNPYNETNSLIVEKLTYKQYIDRIHTPSTTIFSLIEKVPYYKNLQYLEPFQYDVERDLVIFVLNGVQLILPLSDPDILKLYGAIEYNHHLNIFKYNGYELCDKEIKYFNNAVYFLDKTKNQFVNLHLSSPEPINTPMERLIYFDVFRMSHILSYDGNRYVLSDLYISETKVVKDYNRNVLYIDSNTGLPRYKTKNGNIVDIDISKISKIPTDNSFIFDSENNVLIYRYNINETVHFSLEQVQEIDYLHKNNGLTINSLFYAGNILPENNNKIGRKRENIFNSLDFITEAYNLSKVADNTNDRQIQNLIAEQFDIDLSNAEKSNMQCEPYIMFKNSTSSFKGLDSYLKQSLKMISDNIEIDPVYLVQRNRFISEWTRTSKISKTSAELLEYPLRTIVADLFETKLINSNYDDLIDIFKDNKFENFSLFTNDISGILKNYILTKMDEEQILEDFNYYLIHEVWIANNRRTIISYILDNTDDEEIKKEVSNMTFNNNYQKERLFYLFIDLLENHSRIIESYLPLTNYSEWDLYIENNDIYLERPFKYKVIDINEFIDIPIEWDKPLLLIRPLTNDGYFVKRDYRLLDFSIVTNSIVYFDDAYNEFTKEVDLTINKKVDYLRTTLEVLNELAIDGKFDLLSINLVIVRWIVERFIPEYISTHDISSVEELSNVIKTEILLFDHPNDIVEYNRIKETSYLKDFGYNTDEIYNTLKSLGIILNNTIDLEITETDKLTEYDKLKKPVEFYFDFLFEYKRFDIITKVLALFTEDVIATSMIDLSFAINIRDSKGDETYTYYESLIYEIFDEFLPFHTILDKIIFTIKIMETSSTEAMSKNAEVLTNDKNYIDIIQSFSEKLRIMTSEYVYSTNIRAIIPTASMISCFGHDEIPYDYDRKVLTAGHDIFEMDEFAIDDEWYVINSNVWLDKKPINVDLPPYFADLSIGCLSPSEIEPKLDLYLDDYFSIKQEQFERDNKIDSYFIDFVPTIEIGSHLNEIPIVDLVEKYIIGIDTTFKVQFYDLLNLPHDIYGMDDTIGPEDQTTLIGLYEDVKQSIMQDFTDKLVIQLIDSLWSDTKVLYSLSEIPGHDDFAIDEYYHQYGDPELNQFIDMSIYDNIIYSDTNSKIVEMQDISIIDKDISFKIISERYERFSEIKVVDILTHNIHIFVNREKPSLINSLGISTIDGHNEFPYDEYYHNSMDLDRIANLIDVEINDAFGDVKIDFGFMRILPEDPYVDVINQKFYRIDQPDSDFNTARLKDNVSTNINTFLKDYLRISIMDYLMIDTILESQRRSIYDNDLIDIGISTITDTLLTRYIHHDFREHIIALDKYASVVDDSSIISIFGGTPGNSIRDELFTLSIGDLIDIDIKNKSKVDHALTTVDKDYLKSIRIDEDSFSHLIYRENDLSIALNENLETYYNFITRTQVKLSESQKNKISDLFADNILTSLIDNVDYGFNYKNSDKAITLISKDKLISINNNKIFRDSLVIHLSEYHTIEQIGFDYIFGSERLSELHNEYGQMGYTDESVERTIGTKILDSLVSHTDIRNAPELISNKIFDSLMQDVLILNTEESIGIRISEYLETYVDIVKQPWVFPAFDDFEHNTGPHMYNGISEEFDVSTQLQDRIKIDAYNTLYNSGALVKFIDSIIVSDNINTQKNISTVSITDDLKIISIGMYDTIGVSTNDNIPIEKRYIEKSLVHVIDRMWYGFILEPDRSNIKTLDNINYGFEDLSYRDKKQQIQINDWLLMSYDYKDDSNINMIDHIYYDYNEIYNDTLETTLSEFLDIKEYTEHLFSDNMYVYMDDNLIKFEYQDSAPMINKAYINIVEKLDYGEGKWLYDSLIGHFSNRLYISEEKARGITLDVTLNEWIDIKAIPEIYNDSVIKIQTYERLKYGLKFKDELNVNTLLQEKLDIKRLWMVDRYSVDYFPHDIENLEYLDDSTDRNITTTIFDDLKIISEFEFKETLDILPQDRLLMSTESKYIQMNETIILNSSDTILYGFGLYNYIWDQKEWDTFGYNVPYENWDGQIPHDTTPYDSLEHDMQGDDNSQITTGITESLSYALEYFFKDSLDIIVNDNYIDYYSYLSNISEINYVSIIDSNKIGTSNTSNNDLISTLRHEQLKLRYSEVDKEIETITRFNEDYSKSITTTYDTLTLDIINEIVKYRLYEKIDLSINSNMIESVLFKYDDFFSLISNYRLKLDLYKEESDGSISKSMTLLKDDSKSEIALHFGDVIISNVADYLHATYVESPFEY